MNIFVEATTTYFSISLPNTSVIHLVYYATDVPVSIFMSQMSIKSLTGFRGREKHRRRNYNEAMLGQSWFQILPYREGPLNNTNDDSSHEPHNENNIHREQKVDL